MRTGALYRFSGRSATILMEALIDLGVDYSQAGKFTHHILFNYQKRCCWWSTALVPVALKVVAPGGVRIHKWPIR